MPGEDLALDHVLVAVADLDEAERRCRDSLGLGCVAGGEFDDGVVTRVIPLGGVQYIELLSVDRVTDSSADLQAAIDEGGGCVGWAVSTGDIHAVADRLGRSIGRGSIVLADGTTASWAYVDSDNAGLPFFVHYDGAQDRTALWADRFARAQHADPPIGIHAVRTPVNRDRFRTWLGGVDLAAIPESRALEVTIGFADGKTKELAFGHQ